MGKFSKLKSKRVQKDATSEYTLFQIELGGKSPVLIGKIAAERNRPYFNSLLKKSANSARKASAGKIDAAMLAQNRAIDRELFPKFVLTGWRDVIDDNGKAVPFSPEDCADFLGALDDWIFDDVRNYFSNPLSFQEEDDEEPVGAEEAGEVAKN